MLILPTINNISTDTKDLVLLKCSLWNITGKKSMQFSGNNSESCAYVSNKLLMPTYLKN